MHHHLAKFAATLTLTGNIADDVPAFLIQHGFLKTATHCGDVAAKSVELAEKFGANAEQAQIAGWLHDVSAVYPSAERATIARDLEVEVLPKEDHFPMIIHQKLSVVIARSLFDVTNPETLSAIGCHTTLRTDASLLDKVVFVADKIAWDQSGTPPYLDDLLLALDKSIDHAAFVYLDYLWQMRDQLRVWHPWSAQAHAQLKQIVRS